MGRFNEARVREFTIVPHRVQAILSRDRLSAASRVESEWRASAGQGFPAPREVVSAEPDEPTILILSFIPAMVYFPDLCCDRPCG